MMNHPLNNMLKLMPESTSVLYRYDLAYPLKHVETVCHFAKAKFVQELTFSLADIHHASASLFMDFHIDVIVDYLMRSHSYYLNKALPEIGQTLNEVMRNYPDQNWLGRYALPLYNKFVSDSEAHFLFEEQYLFPYALTVNANRKSELRNFKGFSADVFEDVHQHCDTDLPKVISLLELRKAEFKDGMAYRILIKRLHSLELDMRLHTLIEDEVLIEKLKKLEMNL